MFSTDKAPASASAQQKQCRRTRFGSSGCLHDVTVVSSLVNFPTLENDPAGKTVDVASDVLGRRSGKRLKWSEEGARALATSKFLR
jgi:hypothetical protein